MLTEKPRDKGLTILILENRMISTLPIFNRLLSQVRTSGLTTGSPLNHGTPSVAIGLIIDGKDVGCGGQREAGSLMLGRS